MFLFTPFNQALHNLLLLLLFLRTHAFLTLEPKLFRLANLTLPMGQEHSRVRRLKSGSPRLRAFEQTSDCPTTFTTEHSHEKSNVRWIEGRRYHDIKGVSYFLPEDDREADRWVGRCGPSRGRDCCRDDPAQDKTKD